MDLEKINWVKGGKYRIEILKLLLEKPMLPSEIAFALSISRQSISRILRAMENEKLIGKVGSKSRTVSYFLLDSGLETLKEVQKIDSSKMSAMSNKPNNM